MITTMNWWEEIAAKPDTERNTRLWDTLAERTNYLDSVPCRSAAAECISVRELRTGVHHVLRDPERSAFMRLTPEEYRVWENIDGTLRVRDIIHVYLNRGGWFSFERVSRFLAELECNGFLEGTHSDVYGELASLSVRSRLGPVVSALTGIAGRFTFTVSWLDKLAALLVASSARIPWIRWMFLLCAGLAAGSGGWTFVLALRSGAFSPLRIDASYGFGLIVLVAAYIVTVNLAQLIRAVSAKALGFGIERSRLMLGWRGPSVVLDGADLPVATLRERTLMEFLSIYAQLVVGGASGMLAYFAGPGSTAGQFGFVAGCAAYTAVFLDLMPFVESAAYGLFDEWAAVPALRRRALLYALRDLVPRVLGKRLAGRTDRVMIMFCGWSVLWLAAAARVCVALVRDEAPMLIARLTTERTVASVLALIMLAFLASVTAIYSVGVTGFIFAGLSRYMLREGLLRRPAARAAATTAAWVIVAVAVLLYSARSWQAAAVSACSSALAAAAAVRLVQWRSDPRPGRYNYVVSALVVLAVVLVLVGCLEALDTGWSTAGAVRLADAMVIALFVLTAAVETSVLKDAGLGLVGFRLILAVVVVAVTLAGFMRLGPAYLAVGLVAALPGYMAVASFGSTTFPAWLLAWAGVLVYASGVSALWRPGALIPFPVTVLTTGLAASWLDVQRTGLRNIIHVRNTYVTVPADSSSTTAVERATNGLLAWYARFCGAPLAATVRRRIESGTQLGHADQLYGAARAVARHAGSRFAVLALGRVMASFPWDDREELDAALSRGPQWLAAARLPTRITRDVRIELLKGVAPLAVLDNRTIESLAETVHLSRFSAGEIIYRLGEPARSMYVVVTGSVDLIVQKNDGRRHAVARFVRGDHFGGISMLLGEVYSAEARALSTAVCIEIDADTLNACFRRDEQVDPLHHAEADLVERCNDMPLFSSFSPAMLRHFLSKCRHIKTETGSTVVESGTMCDRFYIILSGRCQRSGSSGPRLLAGDCFGHESLLVEEVMPEVTAIEDTELLVMTGTDFRSIIGVTEAAYQDFAERLRRRMRTV